MEKTRKQISLKVAWSKMFTALLIGMALLLNVPMVDAQNSLITVTGTVEDSFGAVIGASVVEKGNAGNGTITDVDGKFSLKVKSKATLFKFRKFSLLVLICKYCIYGSSLPTC